MNFEVYFQILKLIQQRHWPLSRIELSKLYECVLVTPNTHARSDAKMIHSLEYSILVSH